MDFLLCLKNLLSFDLFHGADSKRVRKMARRMSRRRWRHLGEGRIDPEGLTSLSEFRFGLSSLFVSGSLDNFGGKEKLSQEFSWPIHSGSESLHGSVSVSLTQTPFLRIPSFYVFVWWFPTRNVPGPHEAITYQGHAGRSCHQEHGVDAVLVDFNCSSSCWPFVGTLLNSYRGRSTEAASKPVSRFQSRNFGWVMTVNLDGAHEHVMFSSTCLNENMLFAFVGFKANLLLLELDLCDIYLVGFNGNLSLLEILSHFVRTA